jgi:hypothetical protein
MQEKKAQKSLSHEDRNEATLVMLQSRIIELEDNVKHLRQSIMDIKNLLSATDIKRQRTKS